MITTAYVEGLQRCLIDNERISYENEKVAEADAAALGHGLEQFGADMGALATEGADINAAHVIASGLCKMAEYEDEDSKVAIIEETLDALQEQGVLKLAAAPGDNNVPAGHNPGRVAKGESSAKKTDHDEELSNAIPNTHKRKDVFHAHPGKTSVRGGVIGSEKNHPDAEGRGSVSKNLDKELSNAVPNTHKRPNVHGAPGHTKTKGGVVGSEKQASLSSYLASL